MRLDQQRLTCQFLDFVMMELLLGKNLDLQEVLLLHLHHLILLII